MTVGQKGMRYAQITLWDFIVDVVPGAVALLFCVTLLPAGVADRLLSAESIGLAGSLVGLITSYVVGTILQDVARRVDRGINPEDHSVRRAFKARMDRASDDDQRTVRRRFLHGALLFFDDTEAERYEDVDERIDVYKLFDMVQSYLLDADIGRLYRFMLLMHLFRSLYVVFLLAAPGYVLVALGDLLGVYPSALGWSWSLLVAVALLSLSALCYQERKFFQEEMIDSMISDFYSTVLSRDGTRSTRM